MVERSLGQDEAYFSPYVEILAEASTAVPPKAGLWRESNDSCRCGFAMLGTSLVLLIRWWLLGFFDEAVNDLAIALQHYLSQEMAIILGNLGEFDTHPGRWSTFIGVENFRPHHFPGNVYWLMTWDFDDQTNATLR